MYVLNSVKTRGDFSAALTRTVESQGSFSNTDARENPTSIKSAPNTHHLSQMGPCRNFPGDFGAQERPDTTALFQPPQSASYDIPKVTPLGL